MTNVVRNKLFKIIFLKTFPQKQIKPREPFKLADLLISENGAEGDSS